MIKYAEFTLDNGLKVIHHQDTTTPLVALNILYNVGSRDESPEHTGLAHLFEHLMFSGSKNIPEYDTPLQKAGGTNNAFTNTDITNYYLTLPTENIETGFWLESDRMLSLSFSQEALDVQKGVVIEEFRQRYLNQPYGDFWLKLRPLVFKQHPYNWATIGKDVSHVEKTELEDIKKFFFKFYNPSNAIMCIAGNIDLDKTKQLTEKWFGPIPAGEVNSNTYIQEPKQTTSISSTHTADVPQDMVAIAFRSLARKDKNYYTADLLSDILGRADSSRLFNELVRKEKLFSNISCYVSGELDPGTFIIEGKVKKGVDPQLAINAIWEQIETLKKVQDISDEELQKVKNKAETAYQFGLTQILNIAMSLCISKNMGDVDLVNKEPSLINAVSKQDIYSFVNSYITKENSTTLFYLSQNKA